MTARVAVIDDHALVRMGLVDVLTDDPGLEVVAQGASAADAEEIARDASPDLMVLDVNMPGGGIEAAARISQVAPGIKLLMFSFLRDRQVVRASLEAGADGYVVKGVSGLELLAAVKAVLAGAQYVDPVLAEAMNPRETGPATPKS